MSVRGSKDSHLCQIQDYATTVLAYPWVMGDMCCTCPQVLLTYRPATGAARPGAPVTEKDSESRRPLDMALVSQQWLAVRLLITAGALSKCPELEDARRELDQLLPAADVGGKHGGSVLSVLVRNR